MEGAQYQDAGFGGGGGGGGEGGAPPGKPKGTFVCEECGAAYTKPTWLARHLRIHSGERPFVCGKDGCTFSAAAYQALATHIRCKHGERFACDVPGCGYESSHRHLAVAHARRHVGSHAGGSGHSGGGGGGGGAAAGGGEEGGGVAALEAAVAEEAAAAAAATVAAAAAAV